MSSKKAQVWLALCALSAILLVAVVDLERTSPGALSAVHGRESDLSGKRDCKECHGGWTSSMADACLDCHVVIDEQLDQARGLHGSLKAQTAQQCALCHSEHHGPGFAMINKRSFVLAGVPDPEDFDHELVGLTLDGAHVELSCVECHENANEAVLPKGETRFIGLQRDCESCHESPHEGRARVGCAQCHGQETWDGMRAEGHEQVLDLVGGHAELACIECHAEGGAFALEHERLGTVVGGARACIDCHDSPHSADFVQGVARLASSSAGASCVLCHEPEHASFVEDDIELGPEQHAASGFLLDEPHHEAGCADCHAEGLESFDERYPGRDPDTCSACHEDPHGGQFEDSPLGAEGCLSCHARHSFDPHLFGVEQHGLTQMPLDGRHLDIGCNECHTDMLEDAARLFRGTPTQCDTCHDDAHDDHFGREPEELADAVFGGCSLCHVTSAFADMTEEGFEHDRWTAFDVLGAHAQESCELCHERSPEPDASGRRFGRVHELFGRFEGCVTCHEDPHRGVFDALDVPRKVGRLTGCDRCHVQSSFRAVRDTFDHAVWTGFSLEGGHAQVSCSECHPAVRDDGSGRTWARAKGSGCADCHSDPHAGQFRVEGRIDCESCHAPSGGFALLTFDHEEDSRFPLGEAHGALECSSCHETWALQDGREVVRYKPLPTECVDCHGSHQGPKLRLRRGGK